MKRQAFFAVILMIVCLMVTVAFAASFTSTYDTATPLGTDAPSVLDNRIREVKAAVQERLNVEHVFDLTGTEVSHANSGQHTAINCTSVTSTGAISGTTITGTTIAASNSVTVGGTLDVTGNIDPTNYETTNGGFLDEDDMASDDPNKVVSQQSIRAHIAAGAYKITDGSVVTGYRYCSVNDGAVQQVFTKYFTGTTDADGSTSVAHGVTRSNILHCSAIVNNWVYDNVMDRDGSDEWRLSIDATNVVLTTPSNNTQSAAYRIKIEYTI